MIPKKYGSVSENIKKGQIGSEELKHVCLKNVSQEMFLLLDEYNKKGSMLIVMGNYKNEKDWLKLYFERYNFGVSKKRHLLVTQFVNALIIQKIDKEQGFSAVKKLLASGNIYKNRDEFFRILEEVTGINEQNFNKEVGALIDDAMEKI